MKAVVIFVVVLFLSIFGGKFYIDNKEERDTKKAEKEYKEYLNKRKQAGDILDLAAYNEKLKSSKGKSVMDQAGFIAYLDSNFKFDCRNLEKRRRFGDEGVRKVFNSQVGQFGPTALKPWKRLMVPVVATNPSDRMLSSKILRGFDLWQRETEKISDAVIDGLGKNGKGRIGIQAIRDLDEKNKAALEAQKTAPAKKAGTTKKATKPAVATTKKSEAKAGTEKKAEEAPKAAPKRKVVANLKKLYFEKILDYQKAMATLGRLQFYKGARRKPYDAVEDMLRLSNAFAAEAIFADELKLSDDLDKVLTDYIVFLAKNGATSKHVSDLQKRLMNSSLDKAIAARVRVKRITTLKEVEKKLDLFTKTKVESLSIFDSGLLLTKKEKWAVLKAYNQAGVILNYSSNGSVEREGFSVRTLTEFGEFVEQAKVDLDLVDEGVAEFNKAMQSLESVVYDVMKKQVARDEAAVQLALASFKLKTGSYPTKLEQLTRDDIETLPNHPLTGKPYEYVYVKPTAKEISANKGVHPLPKLNFRLQAKSVVKLQAKKGFK